MKAPLPLEKYSRFLVRYRQARTEAERSPLTALQALFTDYGELRKTERENRRQHASRFNIFDALQLSRNEILHSRFLAFLLDPRAHHDQGTLFLVSFVSLLALDASACPDMLERARVLVEYDLGSYGRLDIVILLADGRIIALENKVWASEQDQQIPRYQAWLGQQVKPLVGEHLLVFLTPQGRLPTEVDPGGPRVQTLSYADISNWLADQARVVPPRLRLLVEQYVEACPAGMRST